VREELEVEVETSTYLGIFHGVSTFENISIEMHVYLSDIFGEPRPCAEIAEIVWYRSCLSSPQLMIGSIFGKAVIPLLLKERLID
jgi:hypothetical protein